MKHPSAYVHTKRCGAWHRIYMFDDKSFYCVLYNTLYSCHFNQDKMFSTSRFNYHTTIQRPSSNIPGNRHDGYHTSNALSSSMFPPLMHRNANVCSNVHGNIKEVRRGTNDLSKTTLLASNMFPPLMILCYEGRSLQLPSRHDELICCEQDTV